MKKWPLAWAATGLALAWLTRRFSVASPAGPRPVAGVGTHPRCRTAR